MSEKVIVESMCDHGIGFRMPGSAIVKFWNKKGAKLTFNREDLIEAYYIPGVEYFFTNGLLYTDNMDFKKEVGLEPEDAKEPVNVVRLDDAMMKRMAGPMPLVDFTTALQKLSYDQRQQFVGYVIEHSDELKMEKVDIINKACNANILKSIELYKAANEEA